MIFTLVNIINKTQLTSRKSYKHEGSSLERNGFDVWKSCFPEEILQIKGPGDENWLFAAHVDWIMWDSGWELIQDVPHVSPHVSTSFLKPGAGEKTN